MRERDQGGEEDGGDNGDNGDNDNKNNDEDDDDEHKYEDADDEQEEEEPPASASAPPAVTQLPDLLLRMDRAYCEWRARMKNNNNRPLSSISPPSCSFTSRLSSPPLSLSPLSLLSLCAQWTSSLTTDSPQRECPHHMPPQMKCPVHQHYRRERGREREEVVERSGGGDADGERITEAVIEREVAEGGAEEEERWLVGWKCSCWAPDNDM